MYQCEPSFARGLQFSAFHTKLPFPKSLKNPTTPTLHQYHSNVIHTVSHLLLSSHHSPHVISKNSKSLPINQMISISSNHIKYHGNPYSISSSSQCINLYTSHPLLKFSIFLHPFSITFYSFTSYTYIASIQIISHTLFYGF